MPFSRRRRLAAVHYAGVATLAYTLAWPSPGSAQIVAPPDPCSVVAGNCARLYVGVEGNGDGVVTSSPAGINCVLKAGVKSGTCDHTFIFTTPTLLIALTSTPAVGTIASTNFLSPTTGPLKQVIPISVGFDAVVTVYFRLSEHALTVARSGAGTVTSTNDVGIDCGSKCSFKYAYGTKVTLTARPDDGAVFRQWTGACSGQVATCTLTIEQATSATAIFDPSPAPTKTGGRSADTRIKVGVVGASSGRSRTGRRVVRLELTVAENVSATLTLRRGATLLASKRFAGVREGNRVLTLVVPAGTTRGGAKLAWKLTDAAGNQRAGQRKVTITKS